MSEKAIPIKFIEDRIKVYRERGEYIHSNVFFRNMKDPNLLLGLLEDMACFIAVLENLISDFETGKD